MSTSSSAIAARRGAASTSSAPTRRTRSARCRRGRRGRTRTIAPGSPASTIRREVDLRGDRDGAGAMTVLSNGTLVADNVDRRPGAAVHYRQEVPHSSYLVTLVAGEYAHLKDAPAMSTLHYFVNPGREDDAPRTFGNTAEDDRSSSPRGRGAHIRGRAIRRSPSPSSSSAAWRTPAPPRSPTRRCTTRARTSTSRRSR